MCAAATASSEVRELPADPMRTGWFRALSGDIGGAFALDMQLRGGPLSDDGMAHIMQKYVHPTQRRLASNVLPLLDGVPTQKQIERAYEAFAAEIENHGLGVRAGFLIMNTSGGSDWLTTLNNVGFGLHTIAQHGNFGRFDRIKQQLVAATSYSIEEFGRRSIERFLEDRKDRALHLPLVSDFGAMLIANNLQRSEPEVYAEKQEAFRVKLKQLVGALEDPHSGLISRLDASEPKVVHQWLKDEVQKTGLHNRWIFGRVMLHCGPEFFEAFEKLEDSIRLRSSKTVILSDLERLKVFQRQTVLPLDLDHEGVERI